MLAALAGALLVLLSASPAVAQMKLCNEMNEESIWVAWATPAAGGTYDAEGWFRLAPSSCRVVSSRQLRDVIVTARALMSTDNNPVWSAAGRFNVCTPEVGRSFGQSSLGRGLPCSRGTRPMAWTPISLQSPQAFSVIFECRDGCVPLGQYLRPRTGITLLTSNGTSPLRADSNAGRTDARNSRNAAGISGPTTLSPPPPRPQPSPAPAVRDASVGSPASDTPRPTTPPVPPVMDFYVTGRYSCVDSANGSDRGSCDLRTNGPSCAAALAVQRSQVQSQDVCQQCSGGGTDRTKKYSGKPPEWLHLGACRGNP